MFSNAKLLLLGCLTCALRAQVSTIQILMVILVLQNIVVCKHSPYFKNFL